MTLDLRVNLGVDVDSAINTLVRMGWEKTDKTLDEYKPILVKEVKAKTCKAIVGRDWVTFYRLSGPERIEYMRSVATNDVQGIKRVAGVVTC